MKTEPENELEKDELEKDELERDELEDGVSPPSAADQQRNELLKDFRAWLHLAITASQTGHAGKLPAMPGPIVMGWCRKLAKMPDHALASELSCSVTAILKQIHNVALVLYQPIFRKMVKKAADLAEREMILEQLDLALAFIVRELGSLARFRAEVTKSDDLLYEATMMAIGDGVAAARLIRYGEKNFPDLNRLPDGSPDEVNLPNSFAGDVYQRALALDRMADDFPEHIRRSVRSMPAWPMLAHPRANHSRRFEQIARRFELGVDCPTEAGEDARCRPETPMVRYLDPLVNRLHQLWRNTESRKYKSGAKEKVSLFHHWWVWPEELPGDEVLEILRAARRLPPLTRVTAVQWAETAIVPLILATDARDWKNCDEPALRTIARQRNVKSQAAFKDRLLALVADTLSRLARPADSPSPGGEIPPNLSPTEPLNQSQAGDLPKPEDPPAASPSPGGEGRGSEALTKTTTVPQED